MEPIKKTLAKLFPSINSEEALPFILTEKERQEALNYEIEKRKNFLRYQLGGSFLRREEVEDRIRVKELQGALITEAEEAEVLATCNRNKHRFLQELEYREQEKKEQEEQEKALKEIYTAKALLTMAKENSFQVYGRRLVMDEHTNPLLKALCFFLAEDSRFETELGYSFKKGLLFRGVSGLGKTYVPLLLSGNERNPIRIISVFDAAQQVRKEGEYLVNMKGAKILYIDDVGREDTPQFFYKSERNWFRDFLELYYIEKRPFNRLMLSTNCDPDYLEAKYGYPVRSRIREMFNVIIVTGTDLRQ